MKDIVRNYKLHGIRELILEIRAKLDPDIQCSLMEPYLRLEIEFSVLHFMRCSIYNWLDVTSFRHAL